MCILIRNFHLTWMGFEEIKKTAGKHACQRLPAFFWPIRDEQETRLKVSEEESGHLFFISGLLKTLVKFSLCFGPGKVSL